jgi:hypothetical protein
LCSDITTLLGAKTAWNVLTSRLADSFRGFFFRWLRHDITSRFHNSTSNSQSHKIRVSTISQLHRVGILQATISQVDWLLASNSQSHKIRVSTISQLHRVGILQPTISQVDWLLPSAASSSGGTTIPQVDWVDSPLVPSRIKSESRRSRKSIGGTTISQVDWLAASFRCFFFRGGHDLTSL